MSASVSSVGTALRGLLIAYGGLIALIAAFRTADLFFNEPASQDGNEKSLPRRTPVSQEIREASKEPPHEHE